MKTYIFIYGDLKRGHRRHHMLKDNDAIFIGEAVVANMQLFEVGVFPIMIKAPIHTGARVHGELYVVDEDFLKKLDHVEGIRAGFFRREDVECQCLNWLDSRYFDVASYIYNDVIPPGANLVKGGMWK